MRIVDAADVKSHVSELVCIKNEGNLIRNTQKTSICSNIARVYK